MNGLVVSAHALALHDADLNARAVEGVGRRQVRADDLARQVRLGTALLEVTVDRVDPLVLRQLADEAGGHLGPHERARGRRGGLLVELAESLQERGRHLRDLGGTSLRLELRELVDVPRAGAFARPLAQRSLGLDEPDRDGHALVVGEAVQMARERGIERAERTALFGAVLIDERLDVDGPSVGTRRPECRDRPWPRPSRPLQRSRGSGSWPRPCSRRRRGPPTPRAPTPPAPPRRRGRVSCDPLGILRVGLVVDRRRPASWR